MSRPTQYVASQLGRPRGLFGRVIATVLNRANVKMNAKGVAALGVGAGDRVLDVGFGGGVGVRNLLDAGAAHVTGADLSGDMVTRGRRAFSDDIAAGRVELVEAGLPSLPFADAAFDAILTVNTLYFWPDAPAGMRELRRVTAPGGRVAVVVGRKADMAGREIHRGFALFDEQELAALLRDGGFSGVRVADDDGTVVGTGVVGT